MSTANDPGPSKREARSPAAPLWALHGFLGRPSDWDAVEAEGVSFDRKLDLFKLALDEPSLAEAAAWLVEEAARRLSESGTAPALVGYSMGGRLAMAAFARAPRAFAGAVFASAHPGLPDGDSEERARRRASDAAWARRFEDANDEASWSALLADWDRQGALAGSAAASRPFGKWSPRALGSALRNWGLAEQPDLRAALARAGKPTLWLSGERDAKFSALMREACSDVARGRADGREDKGSAGRSTAEWRSIAGAGHRVLRDAPREVAREILAFRSRLP